MAQSKLNPQITTVEVGVKSLREVTIFPLSLADQTKTARVLAKAFQEVMGKLSSFGEEDVISEGESLASMAKQLSDIDVMEFIASAIQDNLKIVLGLVVDENEKILMEELTNEQFYTLVEIIYEVNYENASKNFIALVKRAKGTISERAPEKNSRRKVSHSKKPSPGSVGGITTG
jgi:hypothetical protein